MMATEEPENASGTVRNTTDEKRKPADEECDVDVTRAEANQDGMQKNVGSECDVSEEDLVPYDSGWAWMCAFAVFLMYFLIMGCLAKSFGVLFVAIVERFSTSSGATAWIPSLLVSITFFLGPLSSMAAARFGNRPVVMSGGLLIFAGIFASVFATSVEYLYVSFGIIAEAIILSGIGAGLAYIPSFTMLGFYFVKRRALANGLAFAGGGAGSFTLPPLLTYLLEQYGLQGALLVLSAIVLHICVCGALLRPLSFYAKRKPNPALPAGHTSILGTKDTRLNDDSGHTVKLAENHQIDSRPIPTAQQASATPSSTESIHEPIHGSSSQKIPTNKRRVSEGMSKTSWHHTNDETTQDDGAMFKCCPIYQNKCQGVNREMFKTHLDLSLLKDPIYYLYMACSYFSSCGYITLTFVIPANAEQLGFTKSQAAFLVSIMGITDCISRVLVGWFADFQFVNKTCLYGTAMGLLAISAGINPFVNTYATLVVWSCLYGLAGATFVPLVPVLLADTFGQHRMPSAFGIMSAVIGLAFLSGGPIMGALRDTTGNWKVSFYCIGCLLAVASFFAFSIPIVTRIVNRSLPSMVDITERYVGATDWQDGSPVPQDGVSEEDVVRSNKPADSRNAAAANIEAVQVVSVT